MDGFARFALVLATFALMGAAAISAVWGVMALGARQPEVGAVYWFTSSVACLAGAAVTAWCFAMLDYASYLPGLHQLAEKEAEERRRASN
jgi:hypothetical protein